MSLIIIVHDAITQYKKNPSSLLKAVCLSVRSDASVGGSQRRELGGGRKAEILLHSGHSSDGRQRPLWGSDIAGGAAGRASVDGNAARGAGWAKALSNEMRNGATRAGGQGALTAMWPS